MSSLGENPILPLAAIGTALLTETFGFSSGFVGYYRKGLIDFAIVLRFARISVPVAVLGAFLAHFVAGGLLIAGALLHALCKIYEFDWDGVVEYTTTGNLVGHIAQGSELVGRFADAIPDFPKLTRLKLQHLILSHHGEPEWGAVKRPVLAEAMVLHHIDNIDARMEAFTRAIAEPGTGDWTDFNKVFNTRLFKGG